MHHVNNKVISAMSLEPISGKWGCFAAAAAVTDFSVLFVHKNEAASASAVCICIRTS